MATELPEESDPDLSPDESAEVAFRRQEHEALQSDRREEQLSVTAGRLTDYDASLRPFVERIMLVERLRETRVLTGFNRIFPERPLTGEERLGAAVAARTRVARPLASGVQGVWRGHLHRAEPRPDR